MRILTPTQVSSIDQPYASYQQQPIIPSNIANPNPQDILHSYVPPNISQPKVHINVLPQYLPSSSQFILLTNYHS